jgi:glutathione reductase (NADPH)
MSAFDYDLLVIGAGSGGVRASRLAAQSGAKVAIVEERYLGGTCVNVGCVPKKLLVFSAHYRDMLHFAAGYGWKMDGVHFDWSTLRENKNKEIVRLNQIYQKLLNEAGVTLLEGSAVITGPRSIKVGTRDYSAERILIATGSWPYVPDFPGNEFVITSNETFHLDELPKKIMIVGGGYIGVEFCGIFNGLGVETHLCHRDDALLKGFDEDIRQHLDKELIKKGVHLHLNVDITHIEKQPDYSLLVHAKDGRQWQMDKVMYATGRRAKTSHLGLENTAVSMNDDGSIKVNNFFQTAEPSIYALGDVIGHLALTPVALAEATTLVRNLFYGQQGALNYHNVPTSVFSDPPVACVGCTEAQAREKFSEIEIFKTEFTPLQLSLSDSKEKTFMKLIVDKKTDKVVGCHMIGPDAAEIIQGLAVALTAGATKKDFDNTIAIHPTLAEEFLSMRTPV